VERARREALELDAEWYQSVIERGRPLPNTTATHAGFGMCVGRLCERPIIIVFVFVVSRSSCR
jgi:hypothetical protein